MTNEELAIKIKNGERQYVAELWANVEKLVHLKAFKYYTATRDRFKKLGITYEDLFQESYFGFLKAIEAYKEDFEYKFNTVLGFYLRTTFAKIAGYRSTGDEKRAMLTLSSSSLSDTTTVNSNGDDKKLEDYIPDERAEQELNAVIGCDDETNLRDDLQEAISDLPSKQQELIVKNYYDGYSLRAIAKYWQQSAIYLGALRKQALDTLREDKRLEKYRRFKSKKQELRDRHEIGYNLTKFKYKRMSSQESYILRLERLEEQYGIN